MRNRNSEASLLLANTLATIIPLCVGSEYALGKAYAKLKGTSGVSAEDLAKNGKAEIGDYKKGKHFPDAGSVWPLFEALHEKGIEWSSGLLGLFVADYREDAVGVTRCLRYNYYGDPWWTERLEQLMRAISIVTRSLSVSSGHPLPSNSAQDDRFTIEEARELCCLEPPLRNALQKSWLMWQEQPRDLAELCRVDRSFPASAYAIAADKSRRASERDEVLLREVFWFRWLFEQQ